MKTIRIGKSEFSVEFLKSVTEAKAVKTFKNIDENRVINAWKQANKKK